MSPRPDFTRSTGFPSSDHHDHRGGRDDGYQGGRGHRSDRDREPTRRSGSDADLLEDLRHLDGRTYGAFKSVIGDWDYGDFSLGIDRVQPDPYAPPSSVHVSARPDTMGIPRDCLSTAEQRLATADFLIRSFFAAVRDVAPDGNLQVARPGQEILERSACTVATDHVELRFQVHLPARGRTILGTTASRIFDRDVPDTIMETFDFVSEEAAGHLEALRTHVHTFEDHCALQRAVTENGWIAFVADGAILARRSGVSQLSLPDSIPFSSPDSLRHEVDLPHAGVVTGMALEPGVTVIVGGGYHGKSTLLGALQRGIDAHVPGDGRELVATVPDAVKVRAADGRAVTGVDVSLFIAHLPQEADTTRFSTENASGSTSQAAAIVEAVELGAPVLLLDEDTSATNLLIRDARMRSLVRADKEPITPLVDRIASLAHDRGVSTVLVMGGSGDYLDVADRVLMLDTYRCLDVTERAREVVAEQPRTRTDLPWQADNRERTPVRARGGAERSKTKSVGLDTVILDKQTVDLSDVEQIVDPGQTEAIAWALRGLLEELADAHTPLPDLLDRLERSLNSEGLDALTKFGARPRPAFLVRPRRLDIGAALNRYRGLTLG